MGGPVRTLDPLRTSLPAERAISSLIYETAFRETTSGVEPVLVESWTTDGDSTRWILVLKEGVTFHDGRPLTAGDAVYSFQRALDSHEIFLSKWLREGVGLVRVTAGFPEGSEPRGGEGSHVEDHPAGIGERAVILFFESPRPDVPAVLSCPDMAIVPMLGESGDTEPEVSLDVAHGTGPFVIEPGASSSRIKLKANRNHHEGRPFLDAVLWRFLQYDDASIELQAGTADMYVGPPHPIPAAAGEYLSNVNRTVVESSHLLYIACNPTREGLTAAEDRVGVLSAIDRVSILRSIVGRGGRIARHLLPGVEAPSSPWDPERRGGFEAPGEAGAGREASSRMAAGAEASSERATSPAVTRTRRLTMLAPRWHATAAEAADRIHVDLLEAGYEVTIRKLGREEMPYKLAGGDFDLFIGVWYPAPWIKDGATQLQHFTYTQLIPAPALTSLSVREVDGPAGSEKAYAGAALDGLRRDAVLLPLFHLDTVILLGPGLDASTSRPGGVPDMAWSRLRGGPR
jgi:ABC-type transport system substrate-binding protein